MHHENVADATNSHNDVLHPEPAPTPRAKLLADDWAVVVPRADIREQPSSGRCWSLLAASAWSAPRTSAWPAHQDQDRGAAAAPPGGWAALDPVLAVVKLAEMA